MTQIINNFGKTFGDFLIVQEMPSFLDANGSKRKLWLGRCTSCDATMNFPQRNLNRTPNQKCPICENWRKHGKNLFKKTTKE